ncbi:MAG TPA: FtsX-like permease family protein [Steroidobacteraceae bacterium]|nr:FtsX-like permease family protein [Steroidobacteraceae bacterium]
MIALRPILSSLSRNKVGAALIALQMAVTLAILCNAVYIIQQRMARAARPSGIDEADDFAIANQWIGTAAADAGALIQADVAALRAIPAVADAYITNSFPFDGGGATTQITLHPDQPRSRRTTTVYLGDQHAMDTLGFRLSAGRNFNASDIRDFRSPLKLPPINGMLVTRALAEQLAPAGKVLGRVATLVSLPVSAPIVGVIDTLQAPNVNAPGGNAVAYNSVVLPYRVGTPGAAYVVRAKPGGLAQAMKAAPAALARVSRQRVITDEFSLAEERRAAYSGDRTLALMLTLVCLILLAVTAFGIVGLTSYWVSQRRRQIGIRRALGATRGAIMQHFQTENLLITAGGIVVGVVLAVAGNLWIVKSFAMGRLPYEYLLVGVVALLVLGQLAALWPALRAASVPPAVATRNV